MKSFGRPYSVLTAKLAAELWAEYQQRPFNVSARARSLGIKSSTLAYHIRGGKAAQALKDRTWRAATRNAYRALVRGDKKEAAAWLSEATNRVERGML